MSIWDIMKNNVLQRFDGSISVWQMLLSLALSLIAGIFILFIYKRAMRRTAVSSSFQLSLLLICTTTATMVLTITSNLALSLGMVGALSIVRFRTAIKNPMDLVFLFWSISVGIICGAGLSAIAVIVSVAVTGGILIFNYLPVAKAPVLLVVNASDPASRKQILEIVKKNTAFHTVKSQTVELNRLDMIIEVRLREETALLEEILAAGCVTRASLVTHDGEVTF